MPRTKHIKRIALVMLAIILCLAVGLTVFAQGAPPDSDAPSQSDGSTAAPLEDTPEAPEEAPTSASPAPEAPPPVAPADDESAETGTPEPSPAPESSTPEDSPVADEDAPIETEETPVPDTATDEEPVPESAAGPDADASVEPPRENLAEENPEADATAEADTTLEAADTDDGEAAEATEIPEPYGLVLDDSRVVVYSYSELKAALGEANGYTTIYLGADITGESGGITIPAGKAAVIIDGSPPAGGRYTYTQYRSADIANSIRVASSSTQSVTLRNMDILGNNPYGVVAVADGVAGVVLTHENIQFTGPQAGYNRGGTTRVLSSSYTLAAAGAIATGELVETLHIEFGGVVSVHAASTANSVLWLTGSASTLTLLQGASLTVDTGYYFLYTSGYAPAVTLQAGASLSLTSRTFGFTYADQRVGSFTLAGGASLYINLHTSQSYAALRVDTLYQMDPGSSATILRTGTAGIALRLTSGGARAVFNQPSRAFFYSMAGVPLRFTGAGTLSITTSALNVWKTTGWPLAGGVHTLPSHIWNKAGTELLSLTATYSTSANQGITSNLNSDDPTLAALNADNFDLEGSQLLAFGAMALGIDALTDQSTAIAGSTTPGADVLSSHTQTDGSAASVTGSAGSGRYTLPTPSGLLAGSTVRVTAAANGLAMAQATTVQDSSQHKLSFLSVPETVAFGHVPVPGSQTLVERQNAGFSIQVSDTRPSPGSWRIDASLAKPLAASVAGGQNTLANAVVFKAAGGTAVPLNEVPTTVYTHASGATGVIDVQWASNEGVLLELTPGAIYSDVAYTATIQWTLVDAP